jgi:iron donor protein CyaY
MDDHEFHAHAEAAFEALEQRLIALADEHGFDVEGGSEKLEVLFEEPEETRFVISPNSPVQQIWISALATSFKLGWSDDVGAFVLERTGETLSQVMSRLLSEQLGTEVEV